MSEPFSSTLAAKLQSPFGLRLRRKSPATQQASDH
jgi:hypothetical protein